MNRHRLGIAGAAIVAVLWGCLVVMRGCRRSPPVAKADIRPAQTSDAELEAAHVNEAGVVPILEYHDILPNERSLQRSIQHFRQDLDRLYAEGYRPILLSEYLDNRIGVPLGKSPVIFTFDDARQSQFRYLKDGSIDPNCAIGILQEFARVHPDFPMRATFYILPRHAFGNPRDSARKLKALIAMGCELGNHTVKHRMLNRLTDNQVRKELAGCVRMVRAMAPAATLDTIALPGGAFPKNRKLLVSGEWDGQKYTNRAVLKAGYGPAPAPADRDCEPMMLPRILPQAGKFGIDYWLRKLKNGDPGRYISDGDPDTISVSASDSHKISHSRLNGARLRIYGGRSAP